MMPSPDHPSNSPDDLLETIITDLGELATTAQQSEDVDLSSLTAELESLTSSAEQRAIAQNAALQEQISQLTSELTQLQTERDQLSSELTQLKASYQEVSAQVQQLQAQQAEQQTALLEAEIARLTAEKANFEGICRNLEQELAQAITQQEELQAQVQSLTIAKAALEQQLQEALTAAPSEPLEETALLSEPQDISLAQQLAELTRQLTQVESERDTLQAELEQAKLTAESLQHDVEVLRAQASTVVPTELTLAARENRALKRQLRRQGNVLWVSGIAATVISALSVSFNLPQPLGRVVPPLAALAVPIATVLARGRTAADPSSENPA